MFNHEDPQVQPLSALAGECQEILSGEGWTARCELRYGHVGECSVSRYGPPAAPPQRRACSRWFRVSGGENQYCALPENHEGLHSAGPGDYTGGRLVEDVVIELFQRISTAETKLSSLRDTVLSVQHRMDDWEPAPVRPGPHDLSALQSSINTQFERLNADAQQRNQAMVDRLSAMWKVLAAMAPVIDSLGSSEHERVTTHVGPCMDHQTELASGSPAAVRCPVRFREGQCLGYAGHDGECAAVPGTAADYQLEDPGEFEECGMDPAPGHGMPPCGRRAGHGGVCASGPQMESEDLF